MNKVLAIVKNEILGFFSGLSGFGLLAGSVFVSGVIFFAYALGATPRSSHDILYSFFYFCSGMTLILSLVIGPRLFVGDREAGLLSMYCMAGVTGKIYQTSKLIAGVVYLSIFHSCAMVFCLVLAVYIDISFVHLMIGFIGLSLLAFASLGVISFACSLCQRQITGTMLSLGFMILFLVPWLVASVVSEPWSEILREIALHNRHFQSFCEGRLSFQHIYFYLFIGSVFLELSCKNWETKNWNKASRN